MTSTLRFRVTVAAAAVALLGGIFSAQASPAPAAASATSTGATSRLQVESGRETSTSSQVKAAAEGATAVYRFWSDRYQGHFYTASADERDSVIARWPDVWSYEGVAYSAFTSQVAGSVPLYRFWSSRYNGHFYTADPAERDNVMARWPDVWSYEGVAYYVYPSTSTEAGTVSVHRFWSTRASHHFYTSSDDEKNRVIARWPDVWAYEGVSFKVPGAPGAQPTPPAPTPPTTVPTGGFPTRDSAGLPAGWAPKTQTSGDLWIRQPGQVVEDLRITNGTIYVVAPNVTLRRVEGVNVRVNNGPGSTCANGLVVEDSEFTRTGRTSDGDDPVIQFGGFTANNVMIDGAPEGIRVGGATMGCGPVSVSNSYINVVSPTVCTDWHGDGVQGYEGSKVTVRQTTLKMTVNNNCWGTAPFFYPSGQGNSAVDIDGLLVSGGGFPFRSGTPGSIKNLKVVDGSWVFGPIDVNCSALTAWTAEVVKLDTAGQPSTVRAIRCTGQGN